MTRLLLSVCLGATLISPTSPAFALSALKQIPGEENSQPVAQQNGKPATETPSKDAKPAEEKAAPGLPLPDPLIKQQTPGTTDANAGVDEAPAPVEVLYDINKAPEAVRRMRELIVEAAASGDIERLRSLMNPGPDATQVAIGDSPEDPVKALKSQSGDPEGIEILAILLDILSTGFVHVDVGTPDEAYVWPYFAEKPVSTLTPPEKVDMLRLVTAGDFADMLEVGNYNFYRVGITPDGKWKFFVAGD